MHGHCLKPVRRLQPPGVGTSSTCGRVLARPIGSRSQPAEGVEVQLDKPQLLMSVDRLGKVGDEAVRAGGAHEVGQGEPVLLHDHRVRADPEPAAVAQ